MDECGNDNKQKEYLLKTKTYNIFLNNCLFFSLITVTFDYLKDNKM